MTTTLENTRNQRVIEVFYALKGKALVKNKSEFARRTGFVNTHWSEYEKENRAFTSAVVNRLITDFGVSRDWLATGEGPMFTPGASHIDVPGSHIDVPSRARPTESNYRDLPIGEMEFLPIRFYSIRAHGSFIATCHQTKTEAEAEAEGEMMVWLKEPGIDYSKARGIEIEGNSMAPRYPHGARALVRPVSDGDWQHARGVHAVSTKTELFVIKRIVDYVGGMLVLTSDNPDMPGTLRVPLSDINCMWKVGEAYLPAER